jgi:hypothetical protein
MPFKSKKQERFFGMCAGGKATHAKCPPRAVIDEFFAAERRKKGTAHHTKAMRKAVRA